MPIVRSAKAAGLIRDAVVLDLGDLRRQAQVILEQARMTADQVVAEARAEARRLIESAAVQGRAQGLEQGKAEGLELGRRQGREEVMRQFSQQIESLQAGWSSALARWERERADMLLAARDDVVALALAMGERIVHRIAQVDPTVIQDQLAEALLLLSRPSAVSVTIHPDDRPAVEAVLPKLTADLANCKHVQLLDDPAISRGGCIVTTLGGRIDATLQTQIERMVQALLPPDRDVPRDERMPAPSDGS